MENDITYKVRGSPTVRVKLEELAKRPEIGRAVPKAFIAFDWLKLNEPENLPSYDFALVELDEDPQYRNFTFKFVGGSTVSVNIETARVRSLSGFGDKTVRARKELPDSFFVAKTESLFKAVRAHWEGYKYRSIVKRNPILSFATVFHFATIPGTDFPLGPEIHAQLDLSTGAMRYTQFMYDIPLYEPPFREAMSDEEALRLGMQRLNDVLDQDVYRFVVGIPRLRTPDAGSGRKLPSERLRKLAKEGRRCLVTQISAFPYSKNIVPQYHTATFDSQTREFLNSFFVSNAPVPKLEDQANLLQIALPITLPDSTLPLPLEAIEDRVYPKDEDLERVMVRQGDLFFRTHLEPKTHVLWIYRRPYQGTPDFTATLRKWFRDDSVSTWSFGKDRVNDQGNQAKEKELVAKFP